MLKYDVKHKATVPQKIPRVISPTEDIKPEKKLTTKLMIIDALTELKTRKGVSLYAIKNHLAEKYHVDTERLNFMIKKTLKSCVEDGTFVQLKGIGASGSFKLAVNKVAKPKKKNETENDGKEMQKKKGEKSEKIIKKKIEEEIPKSKQKVKKGEPEVKAPKEVKEIDKSVEKKNRKPKMVTVEEKKTKGKMAKDSQPLAKKRAAMMKRRSTGSIIKPPKMKPKNK